jgi:hypothetical protein
MVTAAAILALPTGASAAQRPAPQPPAAAAPTPAATPALDENARDTRERLHQILDQYPPSLGQVLKLDPTLIARTDYLAPYPMLANFLAVHPEIAHNPSFFLGQVNVDRYTPELNSRMQVVRDVQEAFLGLLVFSGLMCVLGSIVYLLRGVVDHKRWVAATKIQTEAHNKLFDRLTSNEDLMAYLQSTAGQRYLQFAPAMPDAAPRAVGAPINRIMWSAQTGIVVALGGVGLGATRSFVMDELSQPLMVIALFAMSIGVGFIISALVSYMLSKHLGLLAPRSEHA